MQSLLISEQLETDLTGVWTKDKQQDGNKDIKVRKLQAMCLEEYKAQQNK